MKIPTHAIGFFNQWASVQIISAGDAGPRVERMIYSLPFQVAFDRADQLQALHLARLNPDTPLSYYLSFRDWVGRVYGVALPMD